MTATTFTDALALVMAWVNRDVQVTVAGRGDTASMAVLDGRLATRWEPEINRANGFEDVAILNVGQRGSVALDAAEFERAERDSRGHVWLYVRELQIEIGEMVLLEPEPSNP